MLELELLGVLPLLLALPEELLLELPEVPWFRLLVEEELPLWLEFPLEVPPCPEELLLLLLLGVWLVELPLALLVRELDEAAPEPESEPLPLVLEPWLPDELGRLELELDEELSGVVMRGLFADELPEAELSLELELPVPPRSAWLHPTKSAAAAATGIMNRFIFIKPPILNKLTLPTFMTGALLTTRVMTVGC